MNGCILIFGTNQKQRRSVREELRIHNDKFAAVQLPDNWPTKAMRILDPSTNIYPALLTAVDTCTHWVPSVFLGS